MQTMGLDNELTAVLRELVQFLECLSDVKLPIELQEVRENLLSKCKAKLSCIRSRECSPEAYLDMSANKGLFISSENLDSSEEYVKHDPLGQTHVEYYETFQDLPLVPRQSKIESSTNHKDIDSPEDDHLVDVYSQFTAAQTRSQCEKCGILHVKKKFLFLEPLKPCFVGLIGIHLLIYGNDKNQPSYVIPLRGYQARPISKNQKQSENAFEIFRPGHRTLNFVANDAREMQEWINAISDMVKYENEKVQEKSRCSSDLVNSKRNSLESISTERYQDVGLSNPEFCKNAKDPISEQSSLKSSNTEVPPPLPNRITRQLPKLPEQIDEKIKICEETYNNEENIYHKIEDFSKERYQNCMVIQKLEEQNRNYDDVEIETRATNANKRSSVVEMYDDINSIISNPIGKGESGTPCDNVKTTDEKEKGKKTKGETKKIRHKRSFLDRVRRKSLKNIVDITKTEVSNEELACQENCEPEEQPMYLVPPKPRPVCPLPQIPKEASEELYDDIESCRKMVQEEKERLKNSCRHDSLENILDSQELLQQSEDNVESCFTTNSDQSAEEQLYDDVAILTDFKNRQRQHSLSPEKRPWSRFGSGKMKIFDFSSSVDVPKAETGETEEQTEPVTTKVTSFKRLINKMESSLGKPPLKVQSNGVA